MAGPLGELVVLMSFHGDHPSLPDRWCQYGAGWTSGGGGDSRGEKLQVSEQGPRPTLLLCSRSMQRVWEAGDCGSELTFQEAARLPVRKEGHV